jgi:hypothetical protein
LCDKTHLIKMVLSHNDSNRERGVPMLLMGSARQTSERSRSDELGGIALQPQKRRQNPNPAPRRFRLGSPPVRTLLAGSEEWQAR